MKVIFMGTSEFSCPTLQKLIDDTEIEILAVYTKEPQVAGRGHKIITSPIHNLALKNNLKIIPAKTLKDPQIQKEFIDLKADLAVVVSYGLILPEAILSGSKFGCINIHPSILPKWRGAAPIQRTIMNGDKETGIAIIKMDSGIDSGEIITCEKFALDDKIYYSELSEKLSVMGADILLKTIKKIAKNDFTLTAQDHQNSTYAKKIEKEESKINWDQKADQIQNKIRALNGAYFIYNNERIRILKSEIIDEQITNQNPGEIKISKNQLLISCQNGFIKPSALQREGRKVISVEEFLRGLRI